MAIEIRSVTEYNGAPELKGKFVSLGYALRD